MLYEKAGKRQCDTERRICYPDNVLSTSVSRQQLAAYELHPPSLFL